MLSSLFLVLQAALPTQTLRCVEAKSPAEFSRQITVQSHFESGVFAGYFDAEIQKKFVNGPNQVENFVLHIHDIDGLATFNDYLNDGAFQLDLFHSNEEGSFRGRLITYVGAVMEEQFSPLICKLGDGAMPARR